MAFDILGKASKLNNTITDGGVAPQFKYREGRYVLEVMLRHVGLLLLELWNNTQWTSKSLGCPILSQAIGIEMLKTVLKILMAGDACLWQCSFI